jgi:predicted nucleic acid-binding protein
LRLFDTGFIVDLVNSDEGALRVAKVADEEASGSRIGINDVYVAATAAHYGLSLVTRNIRHFKRIPKLKVENY